MLLTLILALAPSAEAAEVVWLAPAEPALEQLVARQAGAEGPPLRPLDLRAAASRWTDADADALDALDAALAEARTYETRLDGELVIMRDLERPVTSVGVLRDDADRERLFAALAYQGFAVDRYFADALAEDPDAAPHRITLDGAVLERAWVDAVALAPAREVTPYEIAEAPQRAAYAQVREHVVGLLPGALTAVDLPAGAALVVDGRPAELGPAGNVKLPPGRHLVHATLDGAIVARWDVRLEPAGQAELRVSLTDQVWQGFLDGLAPGAPVPEALRPAIDALGGEVWIARPGPEPALLVVTGSAIREVELQRESPPTTEGASGGGATLAVAGLVGWFNNDDFYTQAFTTAPRTFGTVNSATAVVHLGADLDLGPIRAGAGLDLHVTPGAHHVALYGEEGSTRVRPHPHLAIGVRTLQATLGYVLPWHPAVGARLAAPLAGPFELRASAVSGLRRSLAREQGLPYGTGELYSVSAGLGLRL